MTSNRYEQWDTAILAERLDILASYATTEAERDLMRAVSKRMLALYFSEADDSIRADERERCAQVCESRAESLFEGGQHTAYNEASKCAMAIRRRLAGSALAFGPSSSTPPTDSARDARMALAAILSMLPNRSIKVPNSVLVAVSPNATITVRDEIDGTVFSTDAEGKACPRMAACFSTDCTCYPRASGETPEATPPLVLHSPLCGRRAMIGDVGMTCENHADHFGDCWYNVVSRPSSETLPGTEEPMLSDDRLAVLAEDEDRSTRRDVAALVEEVRRSRQALKASGIAGIMDEFRDVPDAIEQMALHIRDLASRPSVEEPLSVTADEISRIAADLLVCVQSWKPDSRPLGNVRAYEIAQLCYAHLIPRTPSLSHPATATEPTPASAAFREFSEAADNLAWAIERRDELSRETPDLARLAFERTRDAFAARLSSLESENAVLRDESKRISELLDADLRTENARLRAEVSSQRLSLERLREAATPVDGAQHNWLAAILHIAANHEDETRLRSELKPALVLGQTSGVFDVKRVDGKWCRVSVGPLCDEQPSRSSLSGTTSETNNG